jgi:hypothetical protein
MTGGTGHRWGPARGEVGWGGTRWGKETAVVKWASFRLVHCESLCVSGHCGAPSRVTAE